MEATQVSTNRMVHMCACTYTHTHTVTHSGILAIKKNEILPFVIMWVELEYIMLSEISQSEKDKYHMISLMWNLRNKTKKKKETKQRKKKDKYKKNPHRL